MPHTLPCERLGSKWLGRQGRASTSRPLHQSRTRATRNNYAGPPNQAGRFNQTPDRLPDLAAGGGPRIKIVGPEAFSEMEVSGIPIKQVAQAAKTFMVYHLHLWNFVA